MGKKLGYGPRYWLIENDRESLRAEYTEKLRELDALPKTDWHAGFGAATDMMVSGMDNVVVTPEYELGTAPPRVDYLFIADGDTPLKGDVFKHFRKFNVLEYKSPEDSINMRVIHKVLGYANFLIGVAEREGMVPEDEVTIAVFRETKTDKLFAYLESIGALVTGDAAGVYYLTKEVSNLPFQIVITSELEGDENRYWRALTAHTTASDFEQIVREVHDLKDEWLIDSGRFYLELIIRKNPELAHEIGKDYKMHSALLDIVKDDVDAMIAEASSKAAREAASKAAREAALEASLEATRATERADNAKHVVALTKTLGCTVEQAMDALEIPVDQRGDCMALVAAM